MKQLIRISCEDYPNKKVRSESLSTEAWDNGRNSKNVKLFIYALNTELSKLSGEQKEEIEKEYNEWVNWDDYELPASLPGPSIKKSKPKIFYAGIVISIIAMGYLGGLIDYKIIAGADKLRIFTFPFLFEAIVATVFWFTLTRMAKVLNVLDLRNLQRLSMICFVLFFLSSEITFYVLLKYPWLGIAGFFEFIVNYYKPFFLSQDLFEIVLSLLIIFFPLFIIVPLFWIRLIAHISVYKMEQIPEEVLDYVFYLIGKNKTEVQIRYELTKYGWSTRESQDAVFESIGGLSNIRELSKF